VLPWMGRLGTRSPGSDSGHGIVNRVRTTDTRLMQQLPRLLRLHPSR